MDVTYFVGNGFDLSLGLKTDYKSFLRVYLKKPARTTGTAAADELTAAEARAIRRGKRLIREHMRTGCINWSDIELAMGECTEYFLNTEESREAFESLRDDIVTNLSRYLIAQARMDDGGVIRPEEHARIARAFAAVLENPMHGLPEMDMRTVKRVWDKHSDEPMTCHFVSFNYTNVLDKCLDIYRQHQDKRTSRTGMPPSIMTQRVFHVHGTVRRGMVFGVSNYYQIKNNSLRDVQFGKGIIKSLQYDDNRSDAISTVQGVLQRSRLVVVVGMSVGVTDSHWWNLVAQWLLENQDNQVIIHYYDPRLHIERGALPNEVRLRIDGILLEAIGAGNYPLVSERFHITINTNLFGLCLVEPPEPEGFLATLWHKLTRT